MPTRRPIPEGLTVTWSVSGPDSGKFTIPAGQLTFSASPDFEARADADGDNVYEVTVVASDPARNSDELDVRVTVTNVAEDGSITFSSLRPKTGIPLTASLTDPDGGVIDVEWQWNDGTDDIEDATTDTYTPVVGDIGDTLSVTATYKDAESGTTERTVTQAIGNAVVADTDNKAPVFPDQDAETDGRQTDQERTVAELTDARAPTPAGTDIGDPVAAEVDNTKTSDGTDVADVLTYTLGGTDAASFDIVRSFGPAADQGGPGLRDQAVLLGDGHGDGPRQPQRHRQRHDQGDRTSTKTRCSPGRRRQSTRRTARRR